MPIDIEIIRASEFIRLGTHGKFDFESTRAVLLKMTDACGKRRIERALIDIRDASSTLTREDLVALAKVFGESVVSKRLRVAILHKNEQGGRAKLFAFLNAIQGRYMRAFETFEKALFWLSTEKDSDTQFDASAQAVPIQVPKRRLKKIPVEEKL
jgi:hypothetical protein